MFRVRMTTTHGPAEQQMPQLGGSFRRVGTTWQTIQRQPSWILRAVAIVFFLVILLPILLLLLLAFLAAFALFAVLAAANRVIGVFRPRERFDDGRENVRVIRRD